MKSKTSSPERTFPWWGYVVLAFAIYFGLKYGPGLVMAEGAEIFSGLMAQIAPILAIVLLLKGAMELYRFDGKEDEEPEE